MAERSIFYAWQLLGDDKLPEGFERALTIGGLVSHGASRWPVEWQAVLASHSACSALVMEMVAEQPSDAEFDQRFRHMAMGLARRDNG